MLQITPLERAALQLLASGTSTDVIADRLGLSELELKDQLATLFARMGTSTQTDAIAAAVRRGLLLPPVPVAVG